MSRTDLALALQLASSGRSGEAVALLERQVAAGNPEASYALGLWRLEGQHCPRDLPEARRLIVEAEQAGLVLAGRTLSALLVTGTGGDADWHAALSLLHCWQDRDPLAARQLDLIGAMAIDTAGDPRGLFATEPLSDAPWIRRFAAFLSSGEAAFLRDVTESRFRPAQAYDETVQRFVSHPFRDATAAAFPTVFEWPVIHALNRRIAAASGTSVLQGEPLQVLRYQPGQQYRPHLDAVPGLQNQRLWTMLVGLSDDFEGGATVFPRARLELRMNVGDAILFRNADADGRSDIDSLHAGAPVTKGVKLIASRWIRRNQPRPGESLGRHEVLPPGREVSQ